MLRLQSFSRSVALGTMALKPGTVGVVLEGVDDLLDVLGFSR
jgi:hypothetical protein